MVSLLVSVRGRNFASKHTQHVRGIDNLVKDRVSMNANILHRQYNKKKCEKCETTICLEFITNDQLLSIYLVIDCLMPAETMIILATSHVVNGCDLICICT